ncbi:MAG: protein kinase, partial [Streptomycetaceae bacterium]|nr:protein kinase [Streptomycetaceae bacterium]
MGGYRLLRRLGGGGFGEVFYAEHVNSGTPAAVKLMHAELLDSRKEIEYRERFAREADFLAQLRHPAVPRLFAAEPHASRPWLATAYVAGPTLFHMVGKHGPLHPGAVRALAIRVAEVLELLHSHDRAHRDLNPSYVLVTPSGPHVIDFGLARAVGAQPMTATGEAVGTLLYMPPERPGAKDTHFDAAGDVFGLGAIALFAATGHPPFKDQAALLAGRVDFRGVPDDLDSVLHLLLERHPEDRPGTTEAKVQLRTSRAQGPVVPAFDRALGPEHRRMLAEHPARPVPAERERHRMPTAFDGPGDDAAVSTGIMWTGVPPKDAPTRGGPDQDAPTQGGPDDLTIACPAPVTPPQPAASDDAPTAIIEFIQPGPRAGELNRPPRQQPQHEPQHPHQPGPRGPRPGSGPRPGTGQRQTSRPRPPRPTRP